MKKSLLALVIASALPLSAVADVVVYGKANVSLQNADENDESQLELVSNASRIGVKGSEEIASGLKAIYQFEYQTEVDDGDKDFQTFNQRNIYIGLQGDFGTAIAGHFDTPTKAAQEKVDLFNDLKGDIAYLVNGELRASNTVQYTTPTFADAFAVNVAFIAAEPSQYGDDVDLDDGVASSLTYTTSALYLAAAFEQDVVAQDWDIFRLVGRYTVGPVQLGALFEQSSGPGFSEFVGDLDLDQDTWLLSFKYSVTDDVALKAQYGDAATDADFLEVPGSGEADSESLSLGIDYLLSKNAMVFGYYTSNKAEVDSFEVDDNQYVGVGMELKF